MVSVKRTTRNFSELGPRKHDMTTEREKERKKERKKIGFPEYNANY